MRKIRIECEILDDELYNYLYVNNKNKDEINKILNYGYIMYKMESKMNNENNKIIDKDEIIRTLSKKIESLDESKEEIIRKIEIKNNENELKEIRDKLVRIETRMEDKNENINIIIIEKGYGKLKGRDGETKRKKLIEILLENSI